MYVITLTVKLKSISEVTGPTRTLSLTEFTGSTSEIIHPNVQPFVTKNGQVFTVKQILENTLKISR
jgi:hypothetical protein